MLWPRDLYLPSLPPHTHTLTQKWCIAGMVSLACERNLKGHGPRMCSGGTTSNCMTPVPPRGPWLYRRELSNTVLRLWTEMSFSAQDKDESPARISPCCRCWNASRIQGVQPSEDGLRTKMSPWLLGPGWENAKCNSGQRGGKHRKSMAS